jgi:uncharacterized protein YneR
MFDKKKSRDVEKVSTSQILEMFNMYQKERKIILYVVVCDSNENSKYSNTALNYPCTSSQSTPSVALSNEKPNEISQGVDDNEINDYVRVNDENMYDFDGGEHNVNEEVNIDIQEDNAHKEPIADDVVESGPTITYDPQNLKIELNSLFFDVDIFRKALRHFAIGNEFEVTTLKLDKKSFIEKYKNSNCL